jgi:hypothetical protein
MGDLGEFEQVLAEEAVASPAGEALVAKLGVFADVADCPPEELERRAEACLTMAEERCRLAARELLATMSLLAIEPEFELLADLVAVVAASPLIENAR